MTLDPKGIEAAIASMKYDHLAFRASDIERAIQAYLKATDSVIVPREPTLDDLAMALFEIDNIRGPMRERNQVFREFYRAMIQAAEPQ